MYHSQGFSSLKLCFFYQYINKIFIGQFLQQMETSVKFQGTYVQLSNIKNNIFLLKMITEENAFNFDFMNEFMQCVEILKYVLKDLFIEK